MGYTISNFFFKRELDIYFWFIFFHKGIVPQTYLSGSVNVEIEAVMDKKRLHLLETENVQKALLLLAIPSIIAMVTNAVYNFVDVLFVGMLDNTAMLAAVSITFPMVLLMGAIGLGLGIGAGSLVSRQLGRQDYHLVSKTVFTVMFSAIVFSIVGSFLLITNLETILPWFGATPAALEYAVVYARWMIIGMVSTILNMTMSNLLRAEGDVQFPMFAIMSGAIFNIFLDPILMFDWGLGLGLEGAAIATIFSHFITTVLLFVRLFNKNSMLNFKPFVWAYNLPLARQIFSLGIVVFIRQALVSTSFLVLNYVASQFGTDVVASIGLVNRTNGLVIFVLIGYSQALLPFAGYNYGAKNPDRIRQAIKISITWATSFTIVAAIIMALFASQLVQLFSDDAQVIYYGTRMFYAVALGLPFVGYYQIITILYQALGKVRESFLLSISRQGIFLIPLVFILPMFFEYNGLFAALPLADFFTLFLTIFLGRKLLKELKYAIA